MTNPYKEPHPYSGKWFRTRTDEQLHDLADGSFQGGKAFDGARAELDRREAQRDKDRELFWIKVTLAATIVLGLAGIAATLAS